MERLRGFRVHTREHFHLRNCESPEFSIGWEMAHELQLYPANPGLQATIQNPGGNSMKDTMLKLYIKAQNLKSAVMEEHGQDLVEYALVVALIALAATAGMKTLASDLSNAFSAIGTQITGDV
jgi:pilus assembly protein Flp/PilA